MSFSGYLKVVSTTPKVGSSHISLGDLIPVSMLKNNLPMKPALFIRSSIITDQPHALVIPPLFFETSSTKLGDRNNGLEEDTSKLQLLPYISLLNSKGEVYCYYRGGKGEEARLHGNLSIGLGGHVDTEVPVHTKLEHHLKLEAARELKEEVGIDVPHPLANLNFTHLIFDNTNSVGQVHLGLHIVYQMTEDQELTIEEGVIEKGFFKAPTEFTAEEVIRMENWSRVCLHLLTRPYSI